MSAVEQPCQMSQAWSVIMRRKGTYRVTETDLRVQLARIMRDISYIIMNNNYRLVTLRIQGFIFFTGTVRLLPAEKRRAVNASKI